MGVTVLVWVGVAVFVWMGVTVFVWVGVAVFLVSVGVPVVVRIDNILSMEFISVQI